MDRLSLGMVQRFAFQKLCFYRKTPQVHRYLIYTDPSLRSMEEPSDEFDSDENVRIYDSLLVYDDSLAGLSLDDHNPALFCVP